MTTRTKITIATSLAVLLAGIGVAGVTHASSNDWGHRGEHSGHRQFAKYDGDRGHGMHGRHHGGKRMIRMFESYDANDDGKLTQAEIDEARASQVAKFDTDGNGSLNLKEYEALWLEAMRDRMVDRFQDLDDNGDGVVTSEEFGQPFARIVRYMDRNDDGAISRDDMRYRKYRESERDDD